MTVSFPPQPGSDAPLTPNAILEHLNTHVVPRRVECYAQVTSTMDVARSALASADDRSLPLLVVADEQVAGRGRAGRVWSAAPGQALLFSLACSVEWIKPSDLPALVWMASLSLAEGISEATGLQPMIKWPNDLLIAGKKVSGILIEMTSAGHTPAFAIIGCGINVHAHPPDDLVRVPATSLSAALGRPVDRLTLLRAILRRMDYWYHALLNGDAASLYAVWRAKLSTLGQAVVLDVASGTLRGIVEDVDTNGSLLVRDASGTLHTIASADVMHGVR